MNKWYCDGSTYKNGQIGQDSSYLIYNKDIQRAHLGNYSINYAEAYAILMASEQAKDNDLILTDSYCAFRWAINILKKPKYDFILGIRTNIASKKLHLALIPRELNLAGIEIEMNPFYH